jgi:hypothetical protein
MFDAEMISMYKRAFDRGRRGQVWSILTRRPRSLFRLAELETTCTVGSRRYGGVRAVSIDRICGSQGRALDFDQDFNPLKPYTRERWMGIAAVRRRGRDLPPVALIQVGDRFFVSDGHHRISVARALGQQAIDARVEVWEVDGPLPWHVPLPSTGQRIRAQVVGTERALNRLRREGTQLARRGLLWIGSALAPANRGLASRAVGPLSSDGL